MRPCRLREVSRGAVRAGPFFEERAGRGGLVSYARLLPAQSASTPVRSMIEVCDHGRTSVKGAPGFDVAFGHGLPLENPQQLDE
jgi:hypothetical protein